MQDVDELITFTLKDKKSWPKVSSNYKTCGKISKIAHAGKKEALEYIAKLNVPLLPNGSEKQVVIGTTKYLLPYFILSNYFITFAFKEKVWKEELNAILIDCIGNGYFNTNSIRVLTTISDIIRPDGSLSITGRELKYLIDFFKIKMYKLRGEENVYFLTNQYLNDNEYALFRFESKRSPANTLILQKCNESECKDYTVINKPILMSNVLHYKFLKSFYNIDKRLTVFNGVELLFNQKKYKNVFGPNIDTILFCAALEILKKTNVKTFIEIGIGSGYISKYIATKLPDAHGTLIDIEPQAIDFAKSDLSLPGTIKENWTVIKDKSFTRMFSQDKYLIIEGDALKLIDNIIKKQWSIDYQMVLCNPPYIPKSNEKQNVDIHDPIIAKNFFEGTYLMRYMLNNIESLTTETMVLILSSTSFQVSHVKECFKEVINKGWNLRVLIKRQVPLKVYDANGVFIYDNKEWKQFLLTKTGEFRIKNIPFYKGAIVDKDSKYPMHHIVYVIAISK